MPTIAYCTIGFRKDDLSTALAAIAEAGFSHIELAADPHALGPPTGKDAAAIGQAIERLGLTATTMHAPLGHWALGTPTPQWRREKTESLSDYLCFAGQLGITGVVIHPILNPGFLPDPNVEAQVDVLMSNATQALEALTLQRKFCSRRS